jgi:hypothetical protein
MFDATMDRATGWYKRRLQVVSLLVAIALTVLANADTLRIADQLWRSPILRAQFLEAARQRVADENTRRFVASYPNPDQPVPAESVTTQGRDEDDAGATPPPMSSEEQELLGGVMGWRSEYRAFNAAWCESLEARRDRVCALAGEALCESLLAAIAKDDRVRIDGSSLVPTDAWPRDVFLSWRLLELVLLRLPGWLLTVAAISVGAPFWFDTLSRFVNIRGTGKPPDESKDPAAKTVAP